MFKNGHALCEKRLFSSSFSLWVFYACFAHLINLSSISSTVSFEIGASILLLSLTLDEKFSGFFFLSLSVTLAVHFSVLNGKFP